jgi:pimeloyl-ACP methyl ester carboxylesterase
MESWPGLAPFGRTLDLGHGQERIHAFDAGPGRADAPVLVFVHGLGDEADTWRHLFPLLSDRFRLIAVDLPGFGRSWAAGRVNLSACMQAVFASLAPNYADLAAMSESDRAFLQRRVVERVESVTQRKAYFSLLRSLAPHAGFRGGLFRAGLARLGHPVLILWGGADLIVPRTMADLLAGIAPQARIVDIPGAGHLPHQERPAEVAAALSGFALSS